MKRQKVTRSAAPAYPTRQVLSSPWGQRLALLGMLAVAPVQACFSGNDIVGLVAHPQEDWGVQLPADGAHTLVYEDGAVLDYQLLMVANSGAAVDWAADQELSLLELVDEIIEGEGSEFFEEGRPFSELEEPILEAIDDAFHEAVPASGAEFIDCQLELEGFLPAYEGDTG